MPSNRSAIPATGIQDANSLLDATNVALLTELQANPRQSMAQLARRVGMSAPAVSERVQRLESAGVIRGYRLDLDPAALGYAVSAWVRVRPGPGQLAKIAQLAADTPEVTECHRITGEDCFLMRIYLPTVTDLETILDRFLLHGQTTSSILQSTPVQPRALPLPKQ